MHLRERITFSSELRALAFDGIALVCSFHFFLVGAYTRPEVLLKAANRSVRSAGALDGRCKILPSRIKIVKPDARRDCGAKRHKALPTSLNYDWSRP